MKTTKITKLLFSLFLFSFFQSCRKQENPKTVYWSGNSFRIDVDSTEKPLFYLGYYIEESDTGNTKLMTRKQFDTKKEYYIIKLSDSIKNEILNISSGDSLYNINKNDYAGIYCGFTYSLKFKCDTTDKIISFIPPTATPSQKRLNLIFKEILEHPRIERQTHFKTQEYEDIIEKEIEKAFPPPPMPIKETLKFPPTKKID